MITFINKNKYKYQIRQTCINIMNTQTKQQPQLFKKVFRVFCSQKYLLWKHRFPKMKENYIVQKIINSWTEMSKNQKMIMLEQYRDMKLIKEEESSSEESSDSDSSNQNQNRVQTSNERELSESQLNVSKTRSVNLSLETFNISEKGEEQQQSKQNAVKLVQPIPSYFKRQNEINKQIKQNQDFSNSRLDETDRQLIQKINILQYFKDQQESFETNPLKLVNIQELDNFKQQKNQQQSSHTQEIQHSKNQESSKNISKDHQIKSKDEDSSYRHPLKERLTRKKIQNSHINQQQTKIKKTNQYLKFYVFYYKQIHQLRPQMPNINITLWIKHLWKKRKAFKIKQKIVQKEEKRISNGEKPKGREQFFKQRKKEGYSKDEIKNKWKKLPLQSKIIWNKKNSFPTFLDQKINQIHCKSHQFIQSLISENESIQKQPINQQNQQSHNQQLCSQKMDLTELLLNKNPFSFLEKKMEVTQ